MPTIDLPLSELKEYKGRNPKPEDFDAFWDRSLEEMHALDSQVEIITANYKLPFAECFSLWFSGIGGARIHCKYLRPKNIKEPHPAVVVFHGLTGSSGDWYQLSPYVAAGFSVVAMDCRGQGGFSEDPGPYKGYTYHGHICRGVGGEPENLYYRNVFLDTAELARIVMAMDDVDEKRVAAIGLSQGGGLTLACAALEPEICRAAPMYPYLCDYQRVWEMDRAQGPYKDLWDHFVRFDPRHEREDEFFNLLGYIDCQFLAERIRSEILIGVGLMDETCPPSTQFAAINRMTCPKEVKIYPDFGHQKLPDFDDFVFEWLCELL